MNNSNETRVIPMIKVNLLNYVDVWGNEDDGFTVNDQIRDVFQMPEDVLFGENLDLVEWMVDMDYLTSSKGIAVICDGTGLIEIILADSGYPLYGIEYEI